jgi:hypothetical protein
MYAVIAAIGLIAWAPTGGRADAVRLADVVASHFKAWDLDQDGRISAREIDVLMTRPSIRGEAAAALAVLKERERAMPANARSEFEVGADQVEFLDSIGSHPVAYDAANGELGPFRSEAHFKHNLAVLRTLTPRLYAGDGPNFKVMKQGPIGDCYFFCLVGSVAARDPNRIWRMIQPGPQGSYDVHFLNGETFNVSAPTEAEMIVNNSASSLEDGYWLCVLEKALGERMRETTRLPFQRTPEPTDAMASGGTPDLVINLFSGHRAERVLLSELAQSPDWMDRVRAELRQVVADGRLATATVTAPPPGRPKIPGIGYRHAYAVLGYDPDNDLVTLWNPWGNDFQPKGPEGEIYGFKRVHGVFKIPFPVLYREFTALHLETTRLAIHESR